MFKLFWVFVFLSLTCGCSSDSPRKSVEPSWIHQPARTVDGGYIVYVSSSQDRIDEQARFKARASGIEDIAKCGLKGSPTVVKKVFAPPPRSERAILVEPGDTASQAAESLIDTLFKRQPALEQDLIKSAAEF